MSVVLFLLLLAALGAALLAIAFAHDEHIDPIDVGPALEPYGRGHVHLLATDPKDMP